MRLLNVETMALEMFQGEDTMPPYTILSHCWGEEEVSLQDFQRGNYHHLKGFQKIESCCRRTKLEHFKYTWIDTCCINKDSSAELSEAINSMFLWYERAVVCYVYLEDVTWDWTDDTWFDESGEEVDVDMPSGSADRKDMTRTAPKTQGTTPMRSRSTVLFHGVDLVREQTHERQGKTLITDKYPNDCQILQVLPPNEYHSLQRIQALSCRPDSPNTIQFRSSRWFTRGWTLQELIAPEHVIFFDHTWSEIGSKIALSNLIFAITGIDKLVLCHSFLQHSIDYEDRKPLQETLRKFSVATRMYWASRRSTSRMEDIAYCLLGIFDINMPLMYGEGSRAFYRLQLEIMQEEPDPSILLFRGGFWLSGGGISWLAQDHPDILAPSPAVFSPGYSEPRYSKDIATKKNAKLSLDPSKTSISIEAMTIGLKWLVGPFSRGNYTAPTDTSSSTRIASFCGQLHYNARRGYYHSNDAPVVILTMTRGEALGLLLQPKYPNQTPTSSWIRGCGHTFRFQYDVGNCHELKTRQFTIQLRKPAPPPWRITMLRSAFRESYTLLTMLHADYHEPIVKKSYNPQLIEDFFLPDQSRINIFIFSSKNPDAHAPFAVATFPETGRIKCVALPSNPPTEAPTSEYMLYLLELVRNTQGNIGSSTLHTNTREVRISASTRPSSESWGLLIVTMEREGSQTHEYPAIKYDANDLPCWDKLAEQYWKTILDSSCI
ncbi:HET domain-containing protein [Ophiostoma piceae UAMH 11346]|uniref:HET domain-containing protein n=1 Tax=Ophiostoma piceae (strain UAMH 11346) TaxID=1262450 RepID=S3CJW6_OPHP1|nr:HET domain-containing protein [Ophiostoma piceae UAMH 11346]